MTAQATTPAPEAARVQAPDAAAQLLQSVQNVLGAAVLHAKVRLDEVTVTLSSAAYFEAMRKLRTAPGCDFDMLVDLCGMDWQTWQGPDLEQFVGSQGRLGVVVHLLSLRHNHRLRVHVRLADEANPVLRSVNSIWAAANWFEREAFDLYGVLFEGHEDLRRILTDYGFAGHPLRKDFPVSGHVEMRYDEAQQRVVYQPVTIEPRTITPRIVRERGYGRGH